MGCPSPEPGDNGRAQATSLVMRDRARHRSWPRVRRRAPRADDQEPGVRQRARL